MDMSELFTTQSSRPPMALRGELRLDEPMARHLSWRAGGSARRAYVPADLDDLCAFVAATPAAEPVLLVGLGSNLLVRDTGFEGTVIFTHGVLKAIRLEGRTIYAEAGVRSALGFGLELWQRIGQRILPPVPDDSRLHSILRRVFVRADDHLWVAAVADEAWLALALAIGGDSAYGGDPASVFFDNLRASVRLLSYRLAGAALDRELLRAEPEIESYDSPFLAQNAALLPLLEQARVDAPVAFGDVDAVYELLQRCGAQLSHIRLRAREKGISIRLAIIICAPACITSPGSVSYTRVRPNSKSGASPCNASARDSNAATRTWSSSRCRSKIRRCRRYS